jgi:hypothetical protein
VFQTYWAECLCQAQLPMNLTARPRPSRKIANKAGSPENTFSVSDLWALEPDVALRCLFVASIRSLASRAPLPPPPPPCHFQTPRPNLSPTSASHSPHRHRLRARPPPPRDLVGGKSGSGVLRGSPPPPRSPAVHRR